MSVPMDSVEAVNAMRNAATLVRAFYEQLVAEGFSESQALALTSRYVHGLASGVNGA